MSILSSKLYKEIVDTSGLHCPQPVMRCKAALASIEEGECLCLIATDRDAPVEIQKLSNFMGYEVMEYECDNNKHYFLVKKNLINFMAEKSNTHFLDILYQSTIFGIVG